MGMFLFQIVEGLLSLMMLVIIVNAVLSWLFAFDIINHRNRFVNSIATFTDRLCWPMLAPFRKIVPNLGGIDITPVIALLILGAAHNYLVPWLFRPVIDALGG
ncbi:MAG: YggT family protein [Proteobacteria bacterium]|nr:YggT family protein [Pseudomonadota bacterium]